MQVPREAWLSETASSSQVTATGREEGPSLLLLVRGTIYLRLKRDKNLKALDWRTPHLHLLAPPPQEPSMATFPQMTAVQRPPRVGVASL